MSMVRNGIFPELSDPSLLSGFCTAKVVPQAKIISFSGVNERTKQTKQDGRTPGLIEAR